MPSPAESPSSVTVKATAVRELKKRNVLPTWAFDAALKSAIPVEPTGLR
jgi:hypothetical protein